MKKTPENLIYSNRDLWNLVVPLVIELMLKLVVGMLDSIMVSSVGEAAVSAVSLVDSIVQLLIYVFAALATGGAIVAGQYLGAGRKKEAQRSAEELLWLNALLSVAVMVLMSVASNWILGHVFGKIDADVYSHAKAYMSIVIFSIPSIGIYEAGTAIFRTMNDSKTTMKISLLMNIINGVGNAVLIYGFSMGTRGAAISTVLSRWTAAIFIVVLLLNQNRVLHVERSFHHRFDRRLTGNILKMGIPNGVENGIFQFGKIMILSLVTTFGTSAITANAVTQSVVYLEMIPGSAIQLAMLPVISTCIGAGDYEQAKYYNRKLLTFVYITVGICSVGILTGVPLILSVYHLSGETSKLVIRLIICHSLGGFCLWPLAFCLPVSLRASGDVSFTMITSVFSMWTFRFGGAYFLARTLKLGVVGVWLAMICLDWGFRSIVYVLRWHSGKWKNKGVVVKNNKQQTE